MRRLIATKLNIPRINHDKNPCWECVKQDVCKYKHMFKEASYTVYEVLEGNDSFSGMIDIITITCKNRRTSLDVSPVKH